MFYTLAIAGGVGGTITLAAYGYWLREKGWYTPKWMRVMRIDNTMAYVMTGIFVISMLIVGAEVVAAAGVTLSSGDRGLLDLDTVLQDRYGPFVGKAFLVGFWAAAFSSLIGVWNGVSLMFADFVGKMRGLDSDHPDTRVTADWIALLRQRQHSAPQTAANPPGQTPSPARNAPCPCGSGKRFKHCHGQRR